MTQDEITGVAKEERVFLHEIASPIGAALFLMDSMLEAFKDKPERSDELEQLRMALQSLERVKTLMSQRRELLIERGQAK